MQKFLDQHKDEDHEFGPAFKKYFYLHYNKDTGHFVYGEPKLSIIKDELELCGYFAIITSEKMKADEAIKAGMFLRRYSDLTSHILEMAA